MIIENILQISVACLEMIEQEQYEGMEIDITKSLDYLHAYLQENKLASLGEHELSVLQTIHANHNKAIQLIGQHKQNIIEQLSHLQKGRKLGQVYYNV